MPAEKTVADKPAVRALYSPDELAILEAQARHWMTAEGAADLEKRAEVDALVVYQIVSDLATGRKTIPGAGGGAIMARAMKDFVALSEQVLSILRQREEEVEK